MELTKELAQKVLSLVDAGLSSGLGVPEPGKMCVEATVCYALGLPHGDNPPCVGSDVREFKMTLNDITWSSPEARAKGMRRLAIAQLGSDQIDQQEFTRLLAEQTIRQILPIALRAAAKLVKSHAKPLEAAAKRCEEDGTREAALKANTACVAAYAATTASATATYAAFAAAAASSATTTTAYSAASAASATAFVASATFTDSTASIDRVLSVMAEIGVKTLTKLGSPGCQWLDLCDQNEVMT